MIRILWSQNDFFKRIRPVTELERTEILKKILSFVTDVETVGIITPDIKKKYTVKKMRGTDRIFKFYLPFNNNEPYRCLFMYNDTNEVFTTGTEIILLALAEHDWQGEVAKNSVLPKELEAFIDDDNIEGSTEIINDTINILRRRYTKVIYAPSMLEIEDVIKNMLSVDNKAIYLLSNKQLECLSSEGPVFLRGSAGSGKTLVEICKAILNRNSDKPVQGYFTYTTQLKENASEIYAKYSDKDNSVSFNVISEYFLFSQGRPINQYFNLEMFKQWLDKLPSNRNNPTIRSIDPFELWLEIRGIIKGFAGKYFFRKLKFDCLNKDILSLLREEKYINGNNQLILQYEEKIIDLIKKDNSVFEKLKIENFKNELIDPEIYYAITDYSKFDEAQKRVIYKFTKEQYQEYLKTNHFVDDNDLARESLYRHALPKYDFVLVDELQDLTELQILALSYQVKDIKNIFMSGDISQVVNPTFFQIGRVEMLLRNYFNIRSLNRELVLNENYRNSQSIIDITSKLLEIRQEYLGRYSEDVKEVSTAIEKKEGLPEIATVTSQEIIDVIKSEFIDNPRVAIIVATNKAKSDLKSKIGTKGETNIFTIQEIKGLEYEHVLAYGVLSDYAENWKSLETQGKNNRDEQKHIRFQYYFNVFYVALTRARERLIIYERNQDVFILKELRDLFIDAPLGELLSKGLGRYKSVEEYNKAADDMFKQELYERASFYYRHAKNKRMAIVAHAFSLIQKGSFKSGLANLIRFKDFSEKAFSYTNSDDLVLYRVLHGLKSKSIELNEASNLLKDKDVNKLLADAKRTIKGDIYQEILVEFIEQYSKISRYNILQKIKGEQEKWTRVKN
jgi:hypothetical protein